MANKMFKGEVINHRYRNRDNNDVKFTVIEVSPDIICEFDCNYSYRVGFEKDNKTIAWVDPSGGPMIAVGSYTLCGYTLRKIWFSENNKTLMMFY